MFDGDPADPARGQDPQDANRHNTNFRLSDPPLVVAEAQYRYNQDKGAAGLAGTIKLGGWQHFGSFDDQRFGADVRHRGDFGLYGVLEQQLWRPSSGEPDKGVSVFTRISGTPLADRNLIDFYIDGGITFAGLVPTRPDDVVTVGGAFARVSSVARAADRDAQLTGELVPVRAYEALLEFNYQYKIMAGWTMDADLQYIWHPAGSVANPLRDDGAAIKDAAVLTLHTQIKY